MGEKWPRIFPKVATLKNIKIPTFMKIRSVGAELFLEDGQADRRAETNSRISQFCKSA
jgi:hypothetical protein